MGSSSHIVALILTERYLTLSIGLMEDIIRWTIINEPLGLDLAINLKKNETNSI